MKPMNVDIIRGTLNLHPTSIVREGCPYYDLLICSFALHLCTAEQLYALTYALFKHTEEVMVIAPHKCPELELIDGVHLLESAVELTPKKKRVTLKRYVMPNHPERPARG